MAYRLGLGAQFGITDNLAFRFMAHYIKMNEDYAVKNMTELSLGLRYMFN